MHIMTTVQTPIPIKSCEMALCGIQKIAKTEMSLISPPPKLHRVRETMEKISIDTMSDLLK